MDETVTIERQKAYPDEPDSTAREVSGDAGEESDWLSPLGGERPETASSAQVTFRPGTAG